MSDDLIKRSDAIGEIKYELEMINLALDSTTLDFNARERLRQRRGEAREILNSIQILPSADRPQGEWSVDSIDEIELSYGGTAYEPVYKCSHCGRATESYVRFDKPLMPEDADFPNFCGWCGARMKGADDES